MDGWHNKSWNMSLGCSDCFIPWELSGAAHPFLPVLLITSIWHRGTSAAGCHGKPHSQATPDPNLGSSRGWRRTVLFPGNHSSPELPVQVTEPLSGPKCHNDISPPCPVPARGFVSPRDVEPLSPLLCTLQGALRPPCCMTQPRQPPQGFCSS